MAKADATNGERKLAENISRETGAYTILQILREKCDETSMGKLQEAVNRLRVYKYVSSPFVGEKHLAPDDSSTVN